MILRQHTFVERSQIKRKQGSTKHGLTEFDAVLTQEKNNIQNTYLVPVYCSQANKIDEDIEACVKVMEAQEHGVNYVAHVFEVVGSHDLESGYIEYGVLVAPFEVVLKEV